MTQFSTIVKRQHAAAKVGMRPLRVLQLTDTHLFSDSTRSLLGVNTLASLRRVVALAQEQPADLVLATGDLVHDSSAIGYNRLIDEIGILEMPVFCLPGNHDEQLAMTEYLNRRNFHTEQVIEQDDWQILMLNSTIPGEDGGRLAAGELAFLERRLATDSRHALVCLHHHPQRLQSAWMDTMVLENSRAFFDIIDAHDQVRAILFGHVHQEYEQMREGVRLLATPSTCVQFAPQSNEFQVDAMPPGFRTLELSSDGSLATQVLRCEEVPAGLEVASAGY